MSDHQALRASLAAAGVRDDGVGTVACFVRVDLGLAGRHDEDAYDSLSERLQNLLEEALLSQDQGEIDLRHMTCLVLGPLQPPETMDAAVFPKENFEPLVEWYASQPDELY